MDGPKGHKVDGLRKWTVQNTKVDGPQRMKLDGTQKCVGDQKVMKVGGPRKMEVDGPQKMGRGESGRSWGKVDGPTG